LLRSYRINSVRGDKYAGEWPREQFRKWGDPFDFPRPKAGSAATADARGAFGDPHKAISFTGERNASGSADDMRWSDVPQGRDYARDVSADVESVNQAKQHSGTVERARESDWVGPRPLGESAYNNARRGRDDGSSGW
jgi:hypothetical protein